MKTGLILILSVALLAAAFLTRPGKREFVLYLLDNSAAGDKDLSSSEIERADRVARGVQFRDRILWVDVERDGKVIYTGAFSHFVPRGEGGEMKQPTAAELARLVIPKG